MGLPTLHQENLKLVENYSKIGRVRVMRARPRFYNEKKNLIFLMIFGILYIEKIKEIEE